MVIEVEGVDCVGKSTQIQNMKKEFEARGKLVYIIHCSSFNISDTQMYKAFSKSYYENLFKIMTESFIAPDRVLILDRSYIGEYVYSQIYRGYSGSYVFDLEKKFLQCIKGNTKLILFLDMPEKVVERDIKRGDGMSFSLDIEKKREEIKKFEKAFELSMLDKKLIYLRGRDADCIWKDEVKPFVFK